VLADLLGRPLDSVALLENHQRLRLAAELAEGRRLPPDLVVRLWWREGNRDRAIQIARVRGAFATGIARLNAVDPDAARELRVAWIGSCRDSGDHLGAVEAAWPDTSLRHLIADDIREGIAIGGPLSARLTAYDLAIAPARARMTVKALLEDGDPMSRELFATTLADVDAADPATDRRSPPQPCVHSPAIRRNRARFPSSPPARHTRNSASAPIPSQPPTCPPWPTNTQRHNLGRWTKSPARPRASCQSSTRRRCRTARSSSPQVRQARGY
jgi:hypothetical protein